MSDGVLQGEGTAALARGKALPDCALEEVIHQQGKVLEGRTIDFELEVKVRFTAALGVEGVGFIVAIRTAQDKLHKSRFDSLTSFF